MDDLILMQEKTPVKQLINILKTAPKRPGYKIHFRLKTAPHSVFLSVILQTGFTFPDSVLK